MTFSLVCGVAFPYQIPYIVSHHGFVPSSLIALFHHLDILVKSFTMLLAYVSQVVTKEIQVGMQKMQLQGHAATKLFITFDQIGHQQHIVVSSMFS